MRMIDGWRQLWWRKWSTWLAAAAGLATYISTSPASSYLVIGLIAYIPANVRGFAAGAIAVLVFVVPTLVANLKQDKLDADRTDG